jgi:hypothetical protein
MNLKNCIGFTLMLITFAIISSCNKSGGCYCNKNLGCKILIVKNKSIDSLISKKLYCSQIDFDRNEFADSIKLFKLQYISDSINISEIDSVYSFEKLSDVKSGDVSQYQAKGYSCLCNE